MWHRSISQTFSLPLDLVQRMSAVCERLHINRSLIAREAIEKELRRYENGQERRKTKNGGSRVRRGPADQESSRDRPPAATRRQSGRRSE